MYDREYCNSDCLLDHYEEIVEKTKIREEDARLAKIAAKITTEEDANCNDD